MNEIISHILDINKKERKKLYTSVKAEYNIPEFDSPKDFYFSIKYPIGKFINGTLDNKFGDNKEIKWIYSHYDFVESHLTKLFSKFEGRDFSVDKSTTIINSLVEFYKTNKVIKLNYEQEYTFDFPDKILKTHNNIINYYQSLKSLYYGNFEEYIIFISKILK